MSWKEGREMRLDADWPHAGAATPMGDAERLMQIEVAYVCANVAWPGQSHERVHVGAVEIHLATVCVRDRADLAHRLLESAVGRWVRDHARREVARVCLGLGAEVSDVDVAVSVSRNHDHLHAAHGC